MEILTHKRGRMIFVFSKSGRSSGSAVSRPSGSGLVLALIDGYQVQLIEREADELLSSE